MNNSRRHLLLISYYYPPDTQAGALRPSQFARYLPEFGYDTTILTASEAPPEQRKKEAVYVLNPVRNPVRTQPLGLSEMVLRKFFFPHDEGMLWTAFGYPVAKKILQPGSLVMSTFPPFNTHLMALRLKRKFGVKWIADFRDPLVDAPTRMFPNQTRSFAKWSEFVDRRLEKIIFREADLILANTDEVYDRWSKRRPDIASKVKVIWNGFDSADPMAALPIPARPYRELVHVGGIFQSRHPTALLQACARLIRGGRLNPADYRIRLIGILEPQSLHDKPTFDYLVSLGFLEATGEPVPRPEAKRALCEADYLMLLDVIDFGGAQQLPSKIFEYLQIGRPIITLTMPNSPVDRILSKGGVPHITLYPDAAPEKIDEAMLKLFAMPAEPVRASEWFWQTFDARERVKALAGLLDRL